jgi:hypothetical protein
MKTFKEYLAENKKSYPFRLKVAGDLPENFINELKTCIGKANPTIIEKSKTPIQSTPLDFPELSNVEVHTFEVVCEYPITAPELAEHVKYYVPESNFRVRNGGDAGEYEHNTLDMEPSGESLLTDSQYKEAAKVKAKDYFGDDFNKGFLKDLSKASKQRTKDGFNTEYKITKSKTDKSGSVSPISSVDNPDPRKGK